MKRLFALFVVLVLLFGLAACSAGNAAEAPAAGTATPSAPPQSDATATPAAEPQAVKYPIVTDGSVTLSWFFPSPAVTSTIYEDMSENYSWSQIVKNTGVTIKFVTPGYAQAAEQFNLMISSQDYTDLILGAAYTGGGDKAIEDGVYLRLNELMDEYAPDYMKILNSDPKNIRDATTDSGNRFRFCMLTDVLQQQFAGLQIREDWMKELGITELPHTYDQYHDVLVRFRDEKTGGEGPFYLDFRGAPAFNSLTGGFDVNVFPNVPNTTYFIQKDKVVQCTINTENYRDYLRLMRQWYEEKLIYKDYISGSANPMAPLDFNLLSEDKIGLYEGGGQYSGDYFAKSGFAKEGTVFIPSYNAVKEEGDVNTVGVVTDHVSDYGTAITTACAEPVIAVQFINYLYTDEGYIACNYGEEGVTFNYNEEGQPVLTEMITQPEGMNGWEAYCTYLVGTCSMRYSWNRMPTKETTERLAASDERWGGTYEDLISQNITYTAEEGAERAAIFADLQTYVQEMTNKFIMGNADLDADWDTYISTLEGMGIGRVTEITQNAVDRYYSR